MPVYKFYLHIQVKIFQYRLIRLLDKEIPCASHVNMTTEIEDITRPLFFSLSLEFPMQSYDSLFFLLNGSIWHLTHWRIFLLLSLNDSMEHGWRLWDNYLYRAHFLLSTSFRFPFVNFIISSCGESKWSRHSYEPIDDNGKGKKPWSYIFFWWNFSFWKHSNSFAHFQDICIFRRVWTIQAKKKILTTNLLGRWHFFPDTDTRTRTRTKFSSSFHFHFYS